MTPGTAPEWRLLRAGVLAWLAKTATPNPSRVEGRGTTMPGNVLHMIGSEGAAHVIALQGILAVVEAQQHLSLASPVSQTTLALLFYGIQRLVRFQLLPMMNTAQSIQAQLAAQGLDPPDSIGRMSMSRWLWFLVCPVAHLIEGAMLRSWSGLGPVLTAGGVRLVTQVAYQERDDGTCSSFDVLVARSGKNASPVGGNMPVFFYIHGGGWKIGSRFLHGLSLVYHLASAGWLCISVDYRLRGVRLGEQLEDCRAALECAARSCETWGGDPDRIFIGGESAGGHLSALLALRKDTGVPIQGVVDVYGVHDLLDHSRWFRHSAGPAMLRYLESEVVGRLLDSESRDEYESLNPQSVLLSLSDAEAIDVPPFFGIHGDIDALVPIDDARSFYTVLGSRRRIPNAPHPHRSSNERQPVDLLLEVHMAAHGFDFSLGPRAFAFVDAADCWLQHQLVRLAQASGYHAAALASAVDLSDACAPSARL